MKYVAGLDLGQRADYTALIVAERSGPSSKPTFTVVYAQRWRGTSYVHLVDQVARILNTSPLNGDVALRIDGTGVGTAVLDLFEEARSRGVLNVRELEPIIFSAGQEANPKTNTVPKKDLIGALEVALTQKRLRFADDLSLAPQLKRELKAFQAGYTRTGRPQFEAGGGSHDDIVIALSLTVYEGRGAPIVITHQEWREPPDIGALDLAWDIPEPDYVPEPNTAPHIGREPGDYWEYE